jgi:hypothetical protein
VRDIRFSNLSKPRQMLIRLCQQVSYGSILNVEVVGGDFDFNSPPEVILDLRLDENVTARRELEVSDFGLPAETCRLLATIDSVEKGIVEKITVQDGIPRRLILRQALPPEVLR